MKLLTKKKIYLKPIVSRVLIDNSISLQMTSAPVNPPPRSGGKGKSESDPFKSPFGDKPFG